MLTICDDHEVTDDWFITGAWRARVLASHARPGDLRNALLAYVLFQAWGNTPEAFETAGDAGGAAARARPEAVRRDGTVPDPDMCSRSKRCSGSTTRPAAGPTPRVTFNYHVDIAGSAWSCSTRATTASTDAERPARPAHRQAALDAQLPISLTDDVPLLIVVSPAPVIGPRLMEEILHAGLVARL